MKDWKFLQVGNTKTGNYESSTQRPDSKIYQTIHEFIKTSGGDADKAFVSIKRKYPNLTDEFIEKSIDEVIRTNKAGNESIYKQETSLFQGLKKDAEKEIGNSDLPTEQDLKNWIRMMEQDKREAQREMERWKHHTEGQYSGDQFNTAMVKYNEAVSQIKKMQEELRQGKFKKVGNETKAEEKFGKVMGEFEEGALKTPQGKTVTDPAQAKAIAYSEADKVDNLKRARNAMNKKNPEGLKLKIDDYAEQGLSVEDVVRSLERFGYDKADIEAQKAYIKQKVSLENK